jgi:hypothetical protein
MDVGARSGAGMPQHCVACDVTGNSTSDRLDSFALRHAYDAEPVTQRVAGGAFFPGAGFWTGAF